ncbi:ABC transporter substrate-binding protein [Fictibacillus nanhaiensis]|uniref:peptide ABC transporter substrate-binding protein n=1 Tax=Fictibacillus nanhaiensis TaxID=742169 RepID=UPI00203B3A65|nr:ABC transporter substrate-binding protein [Fictibacillus nanhaiensis]MCM3731169.1 ABC transporter substrate-binding protein [Fictibacillus nanhaiensis]
MKKRLSIFFSFILLVSLILSGCSSKGIEEEPAAGKSETKKEQKLTINAISEPPSLDPALIDNQIAGDISNQLFEGLVRLDEKGNVVAGVAESWDISDDKTVYTFHLNKNAKWSNGDPVTAEDFIFSWERVLNPEVAAPLGSNLFFIKNGAAYNEGTVKDFNEVGIKAPDEQTLEITLERPTSFFLELTSFFTLLPVNKKVAEANDKWATDAKTFVSNGPFQLKEWKHDQELVMVPNENYWAKEVVKLDELKWVMVNDQNTEYGMYKSGEIAVAEQIPNSIKSQLIQSGDAEKLPSASVAYLRFNHENKVFSNPKIRKALSMALDRQLIVDKVTQGGETPAFSFIPNGLGNGVGEFREQAGDSLFKDKSVEEAKQLLEEGKDELGLSSLPKVTLLFYTSDLYNQLTQAMQEMWKKNLGLEVELKTMERKVFVQNVQKGDYELAIYSTGADYNDAQNLLGQFTTGDVYNYSKISIPAYDELVKKVDTELDLNKRAEYMQEAEKVLLEDMAIAPLYFNNKVYLQQDNVKNVHRYIIQAVDYREAFVE